MKFELEQSFKTFVFLGTVTHRQRLTWKLSNRTLRHLRPTDKLRATLPTIMESTINKRFRYVKKHSLVSEFSQFDVFFADPTANVPKNRWIRCRRLIVTMRERIWKSMTTKEEYSNSENRSPHFSSFFLNQSFPHDSSRKNARSSSFRRRNFNTSNSAPDNNLIIFPSNINIDFLP